MIVQLLLGFLLFWTPLAATGSGPTAEVERSLRVWEQAYIDRDVPALEKILADDFTGIWSDGSVTTKKDEISDLKSGKYKLFSVAFHEVKVRLYGTTAVSTALATSDQEYEGKREKLTGWATGVWVKKSGSWKLVSVHTSKAAPPP